MSNLMTARTSWWSASSEASIASSDTGGVTSLLRRPLRREGSSTTSSATRRTPASRARVRPLHRKGRRLCPPPGRGDESVTGLVDALARLGSPSWRSRAGVDETDRKRRVPGSGHVRHHPLLHQAQLPREERRRSAADDPRGFLIGGQRASGTGPWWSPQGRLHRGSNPLRAGRNDPTSGGINSPPRGTRGRSGGRGDDVGPERPIVYGGGGSSPPALPGRCSSS